MTTRARRLIQAGGALLTICAAPAAATAQQPLDPVHVAAVKDSQARADRLAAEAAALPTMLDQFPTAARLYERSAAARPAGDPRTAECLRRAAFYRYYSGDGRASVGLMERAAQHSVADGDVMTAANAYIDAALMASEARQPERAQDLGRRAELLMNSPLLDEEQRGALRGRIAGWQRIARN